MVESANESHTYFCGFPRRHFVEVHGLQFDFTEENGEFVIQTKPVLINQWGMPIKTSVAERNIPTYYRPVGLLRNNFEPTFRSNDLFLNDGFVRLREKRIPLYLEVVK